MRASELRRNTFVCTDSLSESLHKSGFKTLAQKAGFRFLIASEPLEIAVERICNLGYTVSPRYMDHFIICFPKDPTDRQRLLESFFDSIAPLYCDLIDKSRNLENVRVLLRKILDLGVDQTAGLIIDFGCGVGLSVEVARAMGVSIIGFDPCPMMRKAAQGKGLRVFSAGDLASCPNETLDAGFASYVFHLLPSFGSFELLWARLKPEGVFVANFHKDEGVEAFEDVVVRLGGKVLADLDWPRESQHGSYRAAFKGV